MMGGSEAEGETARLWFDRATSAQFDYNPAYENYLLQLLPHWGGSLKEIMAFGRACLETGRFDTLVPTFFFRAVESVCSEVDDWRKVYRDPEIAPRIVSLSEVLGREPLVLCEWHPGS